MTVELKAKNILLTTDSLGLLYSLKSEADIVSILFNNESLSDIFISQIDYSALAIFFKKYNLSIEDYCRPICNLLRIDSKLIHLGESCFNNLQELYRKLDISSVNLLSVKKDDFRLAFNNLVDEIVDFLSRGESLEDQLYAIIKRNYKVYDVIKPLVHFLGCEAESKATIRYSLQVLNSSSFSNHLNEVERLYFIVSLIAPSFKLNNKALVDQLYFSLKNKGQLVEKTNDIRFTKHSLTTDENLFTFKELYSFNNIDGINYVIDNVVPYSSILLCCEVSNTNSLSQFTNTRFIFGDKKLIGGDTPHVELFLDIDFKIYFTYYYKVMNAAKKSFYVDVALQSLRSCLKTLFAEPIDIQTANELQGPLLFKSLNKHLSNKTYRNCYNSDGEKLVRFNNMSLNANLYMGKSKFIQSLYSK